MAGDEMKAGRVRKLLKGLMPDDTDLLTGTREARTKQTREMAGADSEYNPPTGPADLPELAPSAAPGAEDGSSDDGLLMEAPKPKAKKKSKTKRGTDVPADINGKY